MAFKYVLTPTQTKVLRALTEAPIEQSPTEIAVHGRLLPNQVTSALNALERQQLVSSAYSITGHTGERLVNLTGEGQAVAHAIAQFRGTPPVGTAIPLIDRSFFSGWLRPGPVAASGAPHVLLAADDEQ